MRFSLLASRGHREAEGKAVLLVVEPNEAACFPQALDDPEGRRLGKFDALGNLVQRDAEFLTREHARWSDLVKRLNLKLD